MSFCYICGRPIVAGSNTIRNKRGAYSHAQCYLNFGKEKSQEATAYKDLRPFVVEKKRKEAVIFLKRMLQEENIGQDEAYDFLINSQVGPGLAKRVCNDL